MIDAKKVEAAKRLCIQFRALSEVLPLLEEVGKIDQAIEESKARLESVRADEVRVRAEVAQTGIELLAAKEAIKQAHADATQIAADAVETARIAKDHATGEANEIVAQAQTLAASIKSAAQADAAKMVDAAQDRVREQDKIAFEKAQIASELDVTIAAKHEELANVNERIAAAKESMRAFVAG